MSGIHTIDSEVIVALSRAIDAAMDRGDTHEAIRLASLPWAEVDHWLAVQGHYWLSRGPQTGSHSPPGTDR